MNQTSKSGLLSKIGDFISSGFRFSRKDNNLPVSLGQNLSKKDEQVIIQIVQEFKNNSIQDIAEWRTAINAANDVDNPKWSLLQDLYDYLEPDAQLGISKDIRVATTLGKKYMVYNKKTGEEIPEKTEIFKNKEWFFNFIWEFLYTIFHGYTAAELTDPASMKFFFVPRRNIVPQKDFVLFETTGDKGISLYDPALVDKIVYIKYKHKYGILNDIVPNLIWKKNARQAWMEFSEKFGIPPIWATTNKSDPASLNKIESMLKQLGEAATAVLPSGTTVTIQDQVTKGDPHAVWMKQLELDDQQIAKRLLGGTMITDDGSSRSQSEVHERTLKEVIGLFDKMLVIWVVNDRLMPMMAKHGYPFTEDEAFKFDETESLSLSELWKIVKEALEHFDVDTKWVAKTFNIPIIGIKKTATQPEEPNFNPPATEMAAALAGNGFMLPQYIHRCGHDHNLPAASFTEDLLSELSNALINDVWQGKDTLINEVLKSIKTYEGLLDALHASWQNFESMSYEGEDVHCLSMMEYNLFEFSRMKEKANVFALNQLKIDKEKRNIRDFTDFRNQALQYLKDPDVNWLRTEHSHTIAVGQNASRYHQFKKEADTITKYVQWQTVGDSRVRESHSLLDGKVFRIDEKGSLPMWPPKDWGCRCEMVQYLGKPPAGLLMTSDAALSILEIEPGSKWAVNRGAIEQVFTDNEMYAKENNLTSEVKKLTYSSYGLKSYNQIKDEYSTLRIDKTISSSNISELWSPVKGEQYMAFDDYLNRKMILSKSVFDYHSKERYTTKEENRHQLFPHIADVIADPDEVYLVQRKEGSKTRYQTNYVKFWNNEAIVVNTQTGSKAVEINTWYKLKGEKEVRTGYLVHQKKKP